MFVPKRPFQHSLFVVYLFVPLQKVGSSVELGKAGKTYNRKNTLPYLISKLQANKKSFITLIFVVVNVIKLFSAIVVV